MTSLTKDAIKKSFMKLLNQKQINKITVKEIVEDCGINRNSFYYHFDDIPSLVEEILNEQADALVQVSGENTDIYSSILAAMDFALQNKTAMLHIYNSANKNVFERYLSRIAHRTVTEYFNADGTPNYYYELQNDQYGKYIAPQMSGDQILSDSTIGINLNGRRYGESYTTIIAWDDKRYSYSGLKTENGHVVECPLAASTGSR